jgi:hypothetical protein
MKTVELSSVSAKTISYKPATEIDAKAKRQIRKSLANVALGEKAYQIELWYTHPAPIGSVPSVMVTIHESGKKVDLVHLGHKPTTIGEAVEILEMRAVVDADEPDLPEPTVAEKPDSAHAAKIRTALIENVGRLLTELSQTDLLPPHYRRSPKPLLADIDSALPLVDEQGLTTLVIGNFYVYLLKSDETSEFAQSDNEHVFDLGSGIFIGVVEV